MWCRKLNSGLLQEQLLSRLWAPRGPSMSRDLDPYARAGHLLCLIPSLTWLHSWWILFAFSLSNLTRQTFFYKKPLWAERQVYSHKATEKQSRLWLHGGWRGRTRWVPADQEPCPRWSCCTGWQDGDRWVHVATVCSMWWGLCPCLNKSRQHHDSL